VVAPIAGALSDRIGARPLMTLGLALQAVALGWMALTSDPTIAYGWLVGPFLMAGVGMALVFPSVANLVLGSVRPQEAGQASGANNAIRELGGVLGVATLAAVFSRYGGYASPQDFADGMAPALWVGAVLVGAGALLALLIPGRRSEEPVHAGAPLLVAEEPAAA
jgi:MFS family permease